MSRGSEQTFFQGLHRDVQQTHEKMLNIPNHQRSVNQNHKEISPHTYQNGYSQKEKKQQMLARMWIKKNYCTVDENVDWCSHCGKQYRGSLKN